MSGRGIVWWIAVGLLAAETAAGEAGDLRLVPFPKSVALREGTFRLNRPVALERDGAASPLAARLLADAWSRAGLAWSQASADDSGAPRIALRIAPERPAGVAEAHPWACDESYYLAIAPEAIACVGRGPAGLFHAVETLCQVVRANRQGDAIPCLEIADWPSLRWRCFQDDLTRGPSSTPATLRQELELGAYLKMNLFTYYMEYQYAFRKHPEIGPPDGSLTPEDLADTVACARQYQIDVLGNQQSFGHFERILRHEKFAALREVPGVLTPVREETYALLDDLYSEVCPVLPFEMFNVCCDETWGLGEGPSKELAARIGVGGVYVQHIRRVHDLLKEKYHKRMMMWGDIILQHPDHLAEIPRDTVMLTWGYGARERFDDQIAPFARSGYEFFVCPGINNWSRILPDFAVATTNIGNFVRDGAAQGALGMLNTEWEDDGEALQGYKWHGYAWGAECAWNASTTRPADFNRRVGAVLFGESGDHFGRAIELLGQTHTLPGMQGMNNRRYWENDFAPTRSPRVIRASAQRLLECVRPAIEHLEACRREATENAALLDAFLLGARRMEHIGQRMLDGLEAAERYAKARTADDLVPIRKRVADTRDAHGALGREFQRIWLSECKPYALDAVIARYAERTAWYDALLVRLDEARAALAAGGALPAPEAIGLPLPDALGRSSHPARVLAEPWNAEAPWLEPSAAARGGLVVEPVKHERRELPLEVALPVPEHWAGRPVRAWATIGRQPPIEVPAQLDLLADAPSPRLALLIPGPIPGGERAAVHVYLGASETGGGGVTVKEADGGGLWLENDQVRLLLGEEGAHIYRWEVKAADGRDLTMPGESAWHGFADAGYENRSLKNRLEILSRGPALAMVRCTDTAGQVKTVRLFAGASWMEVVLDEPVTYYWDFDNPRNFAADGPTPGEYLFSGGQQGAVGREADGVPAQVAADGAQWAVKWNREGLVFGLLVPDGAARMVVAPGAGAGGVGIERSSPVAHLVTYAGKTAEKPADLMNRLGAALSFRHPAQVTVYRLQTHLK